MQAWEQTAPKQDFAGTLEQLLSTLLLDGYPTINLAAEVVGVSTRTLQRTLSQQGLSYSRVMDKVRYEAATSLLQDTTMPLIEIAYSLGFKHPSNFSHSFRRWAGMSPLQFRKQYV